MIRSPLAHDPSAKVAFVTWARTLQDDPDHRQFQKAHTETLTRPH